MSVMIKIVPVALVCFGILAFMMGESAPTTSEPAREFVSVTVMMNSDFANGRGPSSAPCMVLFDLDEPGWVSGGTLTEMRRIADEIYSLYAGDSSSDGGDPEMAEFIRHLKNDSYRPHSRKAVPSALARGKRLYVADIMLYRNRLSPDDAMRNIAMTKVTGESRGTISHIPWNASLLPNNATQ